MQEAGTVGHVAGSGRAIVRLSRAVGEGRVLCDARGSAVARVVEMIGPVSAPFASAVPMTNGISRHVGRRVYEPAGAGAPRGQGGVGGRRGRGGGAGRAGRGGGGRRGRGVDRVPAAGAPRRSARG